MIRCIQLLWLAQAIALAGCGSKPELVTKIVIYHPTIDRSLFITPPFPEYPLRPVTLKGMVRVFEEGKGLYRVCQARLGEIRGLIQPPAADDGGPLCGDGQAGEC